MTAHVLPQVQALRSGSAEQRVKPSYEEVFAQPRIAPIPWHLLPLKKIAAVASVFILWWAAFGFMVVISTT